MTPPIITLDSVILILEIAMENYIPVPTDNIYKFYALFSLLIFVFSMGATLHIGNTTNEVILENIVEIETLKQEAILIIPQQVRKAALERKMEIAVSNRRIFTQMLGALLGCSVFGMFYGFKKWHTEIQPVLDEMAKTQLELAQRKLENRN